MSEHLLASARIRWNKGYGGESAVQENGDSIPHRKHNLIRARMVRHPSSSNSIIYMALARSRKYLTLCIEHVAGYINFFSSSSILLSKSCSIVA